MTLELAEPDPLWTELYHYAWFVSFAVSFVVYLAGMRISGLDRGSPRGGGG
jgi:hypothetical protein